MTLTPDPLETRAGGLAAGVARFLATLRRRGYAAGTLTTYGSFLAYLVEFLAVRDVVAFEQLQATHLEEWQDQLLRRQLAPKTRSLASTAVRQLLLWAADQDLVNWRLSRAVQVVRTHGGRPRPIPLPDLTRIQAYIGPLRPRMSEREFRDRALFTVLLVSGARISEALQMQRQHFAADRPIVIRQKGGSEKELFLTPTARERVLDYLRTRRDDAPHLWVTSGTAQRRLLSREMIGRVWRDLARRVGVPRWTSHQVRHSCATELKRAGVSDLVIAQHLGHHNLQTLANYAQVVDEHRQQKLEVLEGLLARGLDVSGSDAVQFRRPAKVRGRPDNRKRREMG